MITSSGAPKIWQRRASTGGLGAVPPAAIEFLRFSLKKLILAQFFIKKVHAVSAVSMDDAKIFSHFMSKSRSLAKISEKRLQPLLVLRNY